MTNRRRLPRLIALLTVLLLISGVLGWRWWQREPLRRAHKAYSEARWLQSLSACQIYLARHPSHAEACRLAGRCAVRLGLFQDADHYFMQAGGLLPGELIAHGEVLLKLRHWDRALVVYAALVEHDPEDPQTRMTLSALSLQMGRYNQAVDHARQAVALAIGTPKEPHSEYLLGNALFARSDISEAASHYMKALETQGSGIAKLLVSTESLRLEIIDQLLSVLRVEEARQQFALLPPADLMDLDRLYQFGRLRMLSEDFAGAQRAWEELLARQPDHFGALLQLGKLHLDQGRSEQALLLLQRAVRIGPDSAQAQFLLSQACAQGGEREKSEQATKRFRELSAREEEETRETLIIRGSPDHRDTQWFLAKRAKQAGDLHLAKMFLRRAMKMDPEFQPAKDLLAEIEAQSQATYTTKER